MDEIKRLMSAARFAKYRQATASDDEAVQLHSWNVELSGAYLEATSWVEIGLRNVLSERMEILHQTLAVEGSSSWWDTSVEWFEPWLEPKTSEQIDELVERLKKPIVTDGVVAGLSFGFWVRLLSKRFEASLWTPVLHQAFPKGSKRKDVERTFAAMNRWRNRAAHHEPLFDRDQVQDAGKILDALSLLSTEWAEFSMANCRIEEVAKRCPVKLAPLRR